MNLCFIPARGGSKRIPRKNVRLLGAKPLLAHTIAAAQESGCFAEIVVSSEDLEVLQVAREFNALADSRPALLAGDRVRFVEVLEEFLRRDENLERFETVAVLLPTCPFRSAKDIRSAFATREKTSGSFVIGVSEYEFPPAFACDLETDGETLRLRHPDVYLRSTQSQSVAAAYHPNGALYLAGTADFLAAKTFFAEPLRACIIPPERALDIDHPHQFEIAEALWRARATLP